MDVCVGVLVCIMAHTGRPENSSQEYILWVLGLEFMSLAVAAREFIIHPAVSYVLSLATHPPFDAGAHVVPADLRLLLLPPRYIFSRSHFNDSSGATLTWQLAFLE